MTDPVRSAQSRAAHAARYGTPDDYVAAKRELKTEMLARSIRETVETAPPLTDEQREMLARLLAPATGTATGSRAARGAARSVAR